MNAVTFGKNIHAACFMQHFWIFEFFTNFFGLRCRIT